MRLTSQTIKAETYRAARIEAVRAIWSIVGLGDVRPDDDRVLAISDKMGRTVFTMPFVEAVGSGLPS